MVTSTKPIPKFSGHETFVCRYAWLPKVVTEIESGNESLFKDEDIAMVILGVGKNMVRSIRYWAEAAAVIQKSKGGYSATVFGQYLLGHDGADQFLERPETLWLLHWKISTNPNFLSHYWVQMLNYWHRSYFSSSTVLPFLHEKLPPQSKVSDRTISDAFKIFVNTYVPTKGRKGAVGEENLDSPFTELGLIRETKAENESQYSFDLDDKLQISPALFAYCLNDYWSNHFSDSDRLSFSEVSTAAFSPGQIFKLPELAVRRHLEQLASISSGKLNYIDSSSLQQVIRENSDNLAMTLLDSIYIE